MSISAIQAAPIIRSFAEAEGRPIDALELQKLVYLSYGTELGRSGLELISDPAICSRFGPMYPSLYQAYKRYSLEAIPFNPSQKMPIISAADYEALAYSYQRFQGLSSSDLVSLTHLPGTPWSACKNNFGYDVVIPKNLTMAYFVDGKMSGRIADLLLATA